MRELAVFFSMLLVVEENFEEGTVHVRPAGQVQLAVVANEAYFVRLIQEETGTGRVVPTISTSLS